MSKQGNTMAMLPETFECPENMKYHLAKVFDGEYNIPLELVNGRPFTILDLGANCGAFAIWAARRWKGSYLFCYEPNPEVFEVLKRNIDKHDDCAIHATQAAVYGIAPGTAKLKLGKNNCGEASLFRTWETSGLEIEVPTIPARDLPPADIIKLDVEASELEILYQLIAMEGRTFHAILVEYHSETIRRMLEPLLGDYILIKADIVTPNRGTLCYINARFV